jgi:hypothetical protein
MKNAVFWEVTPCGPCKNRRFGEAYTIAFLPSVFPLLVIANDVPSFDSCRPDDGGDTFFRNVRSSKSHVV